MTDDMRTTTALRGRSATRRRATLAAAAVVLGTLAAGCATRPGVSNGSVSACYRAIPVGRGAVHDPGAHLIGVHRVPVEQVRDQLPPAVRSTLASEDDTAVCVMAFRGRFGPGQVDAAPTGQQGQYALVLVSSRRLHVVGAVVLDHLPRAFGGRVI